MNYTFTNLFKCAQIEYPFLKNCVIILIKLFKFKFLNNLIECVICYKEQLNIDLHGVCIL
jgi:hypothetical protein